jgi:hypothetical protein
LSVPLYLARRLIYLLQQALFGMFTVSLCKCAALCMLQQTSLLLFTLGVSECVTLLYSPRCAFHLVYIIWYCQMAWLTAWQFTHRVPMHFSAYLFLYRLISHNFTRLCASHLARCYVLSVAPNQLWLLVILMLWVDHRWHSRLISEVS